MDAPKELLGLGNVEGLGAEVPELLGHELRRDLDPRVDGDGHAAREKRQRERGGRERRESGADDGWRQRVDDARAWLAAREPRELLVGPRECVGRGE